MKRIAVVGAGMSALYLARLLNKHLDLDLTLFEKSLRSGGRMATRIQDNLVFNHGAFEIPSLAEEKLNKLCPDNLILWPHKLASFDRGQLINIEVVETVIGHPHSNAIARSLAHGLRIHYDALVTSLQYRDAKWQLSIKNNPLREEFDIIILAIPPKQAYDLLPKSMVDNYLADSVMLPCYSIMLAVDANRPDWEEAKFQNSVLDKVLIRKKDDGPQPLLQVVTHANPLWSRAHIEKHEIAIAEKLISSLKDYLDFSSKQNRFQAFHRWLYAFPSKSNNAFMYDDELCCGFIGDWTLTNAHCAGLDAALASADKMAKHLLNCL